MKRPSFQFYPSDWLRDTALRTCSVGARGLWMDMLCFMHEGSPYGWLKVGNKVILPANLACMVGATLHDIEGWLSELRIANVFDEDESGCILSRRMVRDENLRQTRAAGGIKGGNPKLMGDKVNLDPNLKRKNKVKQKSTPSSSSSPSSSPSDLLLDAECEHSETASSKSKATIEELKEYAVEIGLPATDGEFMFESWESNGWKNGKEPVRDWKAGIRKWKLGGWLPSQKSAQQSLGFGKRQPDPNRLLNGEVTNEAHERGF